MNCSFAELRRCRSVAMGLAAVIAICACCPSGKYSGDGEIRSERCWPSSNYTVLFQPLSLTKTGSYQYDIQALPDLDAVIGLTVTTPAGVTCETLKHSVGATAVVSMTLQSKADGVGARGEGALSDWIWSYRLPSNPPIPSEHAECFLYTRSLYFSPRKARNLTLNVVVEMPAGASMAIVPTVKSYAVYAP